MFFSSFPHLHLFPLSVGDPDLAPRPEREAEEVEGQGAGQRVVDGNHVPKNKGLSLFQEWFVSN